MNNAANRVFDKRANQLYKKVGRRYIPVNDPCAYDGLREGWWLVHVGDEFTSIKSQVYPNNAEIDAAIKQKEDSLVDIINEATKLEPQKKDLSPECVKDWKAFIKKHGEEMGYLERPSIRDMATKIMELVRK